MKTIIVTGNKDGGKTTFLVELVKELSEHGCEVRGFVSKGEYDEDNNKDFILQNLENGESLHLASRKKHSKYQKHFGFYFNPDTIDYGRNLITKILNAQNEILILDEIGPVEMQGNVWHKSMLELREKYQGTLIISVRDSLVEDIITFYRLEGCNLFDIEKNEPSVLAEHICK